MACNYTDVLQSQKLEKLGRVKMLVQEAELKSKGSSTDEPDNDEDYHGPKSNFSLLDQHSKLKKVAEGEFDLLSCYSDLVFKILSWVYIRNHKV